MHFMKHQSYDKHLIINATILGPIMKYISLRTGEINAPIFDK
jgi:hypothetical protein